MRRAVVLIGVIAVVLAAATPAERVGRGLYHAGLPGLAGLFLDGQVWQGATRYAQGRFAEAASAFAGAPFGGADYNRGTALAKAGELDQSVQALESALHHDPNDEDARYNLAIVEALKEKRARAERDAVGSANANAAKQKRGEMAASDEKQVNSTGDGAAGDRDSGSEANSPGRAQVIRAGRAEQTKVDWLGGEALGSVGDADGAGRTGGDSSKVASPFDRAIKLPKRSFSQQTVQASPQWLQTIADDPGRFLRLKLAAERSGRAERGLAAPSVTDPW